MDLPQAAGNEDSNLAASGRMKRLLAPIVLALALTASFAAWPTTSTVEAARKCTPKAECCKVCDKGKACGNSCISKKFTCRKGRGCACDAKEVCR